VYGDRDREPEALGPGAKQRHKIKTFQLTADATSTQG